MDHEELYKKFSKDVETLRSDIHRVEMHLASKLDGYQQRVTKLESDQGWMRWVLVLIITTLLGLGTFYIRKAEASTLTNDRKQKHEEVIRHSRETPI